LHKIWPYLPAFRAVAETEHLPTAAAQLHVVPSALSRSVRLMEETVGAPLFGRRGRRLVLNARGRALLQAMQQGALALERGLGRASGDAFEGDLNVGTIGVLTNHIVLPVLLDVAARNPKVQPALRTAKPRDANHRLVIGSLDLAFYYDALAMDGICCGRLGALSASVYCGKTHPLYGLKRVTQAQMLEHPFSIPDIGDRNVTMDGWPVHLERKVGFRIDLLLTNLEVALSGHFLTVLPDVVAAPHAKRLRRFPFDIVPSIEVYGACREGEDDLPHHRMIFEAVTKRLLKLGAA